MIWIVPPTGDNHELRAAIIANRNAIIAELKAEPPKPKKKTEGLGDWAERQLSKLGITEDRYTKIKERFGLPPRCGCKKRKAWLNEVSDWLTGT